MYDCQSGLSKNHSSCTAPIKTIDKWNNEIDVVNYVDAVFVDLSKAFDMVNHELLIQNCIQWELRKMRFCGLNHERTQCVSVNNSMSTPNVTS